MKLHLKVRKRLLKRFIVTGILFPLTFFLFSLLRYLLIRFSLYDPAVSPFAEVAFIVLSATLLYKPVDALVFWALKRTFFGAHVNFETALHQLTRDAIAILDRQQLANLIVNIFGEVFSVKAASVFMFDKPKEVYRAVSAFGISPHVWRHLTFTAHHPFMELLKAHRLPLERERLRRSFSWQDANQFGRHFEELHAACMVPIMAQEELLGAISLMPGERMRFFNSHDIRSFADFAREIAPAFRNASVMGELREANEALIHIQSKFLHSAQHSAIHELATGIAHEIHNPLTIISGKAQILLLKKDQKFYDDQVEEVLKTIVKQTKRASDITRKLLMFAESEKLVKEPVDFEVLINDTIALVSYQVSLDEIQVIKRLEHPIPKFFGNVGELREAFLNLFLNAVQAIGKKGTVQVDMKYRKTDRMIELRISDSGPGISEGHLAKIFQPFFTTRPSQTGLGLFVTQQIVYGYGGSIRAESKTGEGTTFVVELPCRSNVLAGGERPDFGSPETFVDQSGLHAV